MKTPITDMVREHRGDYLAAVEDLEISHAALLEGARVALEELEFVYRHYETSNGGEVEPILQLRAAIATGLGGSSQ